ncbi:metallophosphoesterase [Candidatus Daviesbacteria bacterium]|nr:metallophosphoesterase [Candidatus Daviesbacteria bacterium]
MFRSYEGRRSSSPLKPLFSLFRLILSFVIMAVLLLGIYQAYKSFSGIDPLKADPKAIFANILSSDEAYKLITGIFTLSPNQSLDQAKKLIKKDLTANNDSNATILGKTSKPVSSSPVAFKFAVVTDSHNDNQDLAKALNQAKDAGVKFIIGLGDSDNYLGIDELEESWIKDELNRTQTDKPKLIFVLTSSPFFHPSSDHIMGKLDPKLRAQAERLINLFKESNVSEVIAGDTHFYTSYSEPKTNLKMTTVGAITSSRNAQAPRFAIVDVFEDGSYNIQDTEIK